MAKKIKLTIRAHKKINKIAEYIEKEFGFTVAQTFSRQTIDFLTLLSNYPNLGTCIDPKKKVFGFVYSKQTTIFYRLTDDEIIVLNLFDNRANPQNNKF